MRENQLCAFPKTLPCTRVQTPPENLDLLRAKKNDLFFFSKFLGKIIENFCPQLRANRKIFLSFRPQGAGEMGLTRKICGRKVILACGLRAKTHFGLRVAGDPPEIRGGLGGVCTRVKGTSLNLLRGVHF